MVVLHFELGSLCRCPVSKPLNSIEQRVARLLFAVVSFSRLMAPLLAYLERLIGTNINKYLALTRMLTLCWLSPVDSRKLPAPRAIVLFPSSLSVEPIAVC